MPSHNANTHTYGASHLLLFFSILFSLLLPVRPVEAEEWQQWPAQLRDEALLRERSALGKLFTYKKDDHTQAVEIYLRAKQNQKSNAALLERLGLSSNAAQKTLYDRLMLLLTFEGDKAKHPAEFLLDLPDIPATPSPRLNLEVEGSYVRNDYSRDAAESLYPSGIMDVSEDGAQLLLCQNGLVIVFHAGTGKELWRSMNSYEYAFFYKNTVVACFPSELGLLWHRLDRKTGLLSGGKNLSTTRDITFVGRSKDGRFLAIAEKYAFGSLKCIEAIDLDSLEYHTHDLNKENAASALVWARERWNIVSYMTGRECASPPPPAKAGRRPVQVHSPSWRYTVYIEEGCRFLLTDRKNGESRSFSLQGASAKNLLVLTDAIFSPDESLLALFDASRNVTLISLTDEPEVKHIFTAEDLPPHLGRLQQIFPDKNTPSITAVFSLTPEAGPYTSKALVHLDMAKHSVTAGHVFGMSPLRQIAGVVVSPQERAYIAFTDGSCIALDLPEGKVTPILSPSSHKWSALALSGDGKKIFLGASSGEIFTLAPHGLKLLTRQQQGIRTLLADTTGEQLWILSGEEENVVMWNPNFATVDEPEMALSYLSLKGERQVSHCPQTIKQLAALHYDADADMAFIYSPDDELKSKRGEEEVTFGRGNVFPSVETGTCIQGRAVYLSSCYMLTESRNLGIEVCANNYFNNGHNFVQNKTGLSRIGTPKKDKLPAAATLGDNGCYATLPDRSGTPFIFYNAETGDAILAGKNDTFQNFPNSGGLFSSTPGRFISWSNDGLISLWDLSQKHSRPQLNWLFFTNGNWLVMDEQSRFDTPDIDALSMLMWKDTERPGFPVPFDAFMRDYYQPRLAEMVIQKAALPDVPDLSARNTFQHEVEITSIHPSSPTSVDVTISIKGISPEQPLNDIKLFRNKQLVAFTAAGTSLTSEADGSARLSFNDIPLPQQDRTVVFRAYGFNSDRVRSIVAEKSFSYIPAQPDTKRQLHLVSIGINEFDNPTWNLSYAVNDARAFSDAVTKALGDHIPVQAVRLTTDHADIPPNKQSIAQALSNLGKPLPEKEAYRGGWPGPDDVVLITVATHGLTDNNEFYILPKDISGSGTDVTPELIARAISTEELNTWLRNVQAGEIILILDTCQSGAALGGKTFKPGPMGDRGFGQLAYDKGMRVICATNENNAALEFGQLGHGLLSYALLEELDNFASGRTTRFSTKSWLQKARERTIQIQAFIRSGKQVNASRGRVVHLVKLPTARQDLGQEPYLFDFGGKALHVDQ